MRCLKIPRRYLIYCFGFLLSFFFTFSFCSSSSFAADDLTFTLSSSETSICTDWTSSYNSLCGYHYVILEDLTATGRGTGVRCNLSYPGNIHSYDLSNSFASFAILSPHFSSGFNYSSVSCYATSSFASIRLTLTDSYIPASPSGSLSITENGTYDVSSYAEAVVDVPIEVVQGDYHDDLTTINQSILICGAILLVIYFFYAIYRMIMRGSHGR